MALHRTPKEQAAVDRTETSRLMQEAQDTDPSNSRRWGVCSMASMGTLRIHGWFKTRTDAIRCVPFYYLAQPILARWSDNQRCL